MKIRSFQIGLVDTALSAVGLFCLTYGAYYVTERELSLAVTALSAGVILLFAATIDRFELLKGWGIEAKTRKLDATIDRADLAIAQVKELAELTGSALISLNSSIGRRGGTPTIAENYALSRKVFGILTRLNTSRSEIRAALDPWARTAAIDCFRDLIRQANDLINARIQALTVANQHLVGDERQNFALQCGRDSSYVGQFASGLDAWQLEDYSVKALQMFDGLPLLEAATRAAHRPAFERAAAELAFLATEMDFRDRPMWQDVRSR